MHESSPVPGGTSIRLSNEANKYIASQYYPDDKVDNTHQVFRNENLELLTFKNQSIEMHVTQDVFEHVLDPRQAFKEIAKILRPGGAHVFTPLLVNKSSATEWCARRKSDGSIEQLAHPPEFQG